MGKAMIMRKHRSRHTRHWKLTAITLLFAVYACAPLYYSTLEPDLLRLGATGLCGLLFVATSCIRQPIRRIAALCGLCACFAIWFCTNLPSNNREWAGEYAVLADAIQDGRTVHVRNIRDFTYKTETDYTPHYYNADFDLDHLATIDLITSYWAGDSIAHVFLSFGFDDGRHLAVSIETRRQKKFSYSTIAGFFHHYELTYVTADERDLIGVRTDIRKERVYLYRLELSAQTREAVFKNYLTEIHKLTTTPRWYNTLMDNCTTEILARANARTRYRLDWRVLLSGYTASLAYDLGLLNTHYDFATLHELSRIKRPANAVPDANYSNEIRESLPLALANK